MFLKQMKWALLWAMLIFILCAIPGNDIPFGGFWELFNLDKFIHASIFFIQALFLIQGFNNQTKFIIFNRYPKAFALVICIMYGGDLELMQGAFFQDRTADILDFIANSIGALFGTLLFDRILNKYNQLRKKIEK